MKTIKEFVAISPEEPPCKPLLDERPRNHLLILRVLLLHPVVFVQTALRLCNTICAFIDVLCGIQIIDNSLPVNSVSDYESTCSCA